jgi:uncharacterized damage-inducible protein DinB
MPCGTPSSKARRIETGLERSFEKRGRVVTPTFGTWKRAGPMMARLVHTKRGWPGSEVLRIFGVTRVNTNEVGHERYRPSDLQSAPTVLEQVEMSRLAEIRKLYEYNRWANHRVLDAVSSIPDDEFLRDLGSSFPSVRDTLVHILAAEWVWVSRWEGVSPTAMPEGWASSTYDQLRVHWREVEQRQQKFLANGTEDRLDQPVAYQTTDGQRFEIPLWQLLRHVVNHSTYHRGQVITMLRQLGAGTVSTDLVLFYRTVKD